MAAGSDSWAVKQGWVSVTPLGLRSDIAFSQVTLGMVSASGIDTCACPHGTPSHTITQACHLSEASQPVEDGKCNELRAL